MKEENWDVETIISGVLRWGVALSLVLLGGGTALFLFHSADFNQAGGTAQDFHRLLALRPLNEYTWAWFTDGLAHWRGDVFVIPGLLLLIATPVLRVMVSIIAFALEKDRVYVAITSLVLALLILSFVLGKAG